MKQRCPEFGPAMSCRIVGRSICLAALAGLLLCVKLAEASPSTALPPPSWPQPARAPGGAPTILLIMTDDVGFGAASTFGGPVPTPTLDALARSGIRYNRFHTTGICSPTRAALLTGRDHTAVGMGNVADAATGFEGYTSVIPKSAATVARILRDAGYATAMFGKNHVTPHWTTGPAGPFDRWPTGLGFDYFYGFMGGDTNQFAPALYEDNRPIDAPRDDPSYILDRDLADKAIARLRQVNATAPGKPQFIYFAPGTAHAPHHAPREWIDRFKGRFDSGWDVLRQETLARQKRLGVVPAGTRLADRPPAIPAWSTLSPLQRQVYAREMEVFAGSLAYADVQIGRVVDEARRLYGDNVLVIYIQGDNGGSAEGGLDGTLNEHGVLNGVSAPLEEIARRLDTLGGPQAYGHYSFGWAHATNTPFPWVKQVPSHLGATRNGMVIDWPGQITEPEKVRQQFAHVIDVMPTILDAAGVPAPQQVDGIEQQPVDGVSLRPTFANPSAPELRRTQFFVIWDNMGIYHDGWMASSWPESMPWVFMRAQPTRIEGRRWQLFNLRDDFSQSTDLAEKHPEKLADLVARFWREAERAHALPVHRYEGREGMPDAYAGRDTVTFHGPQSHLPEVAAPRMLNRSFTLTALVDVPEQGASGVLLAVGGRFGGMSWFIDDGRLAFHYNLADMARYEVMATDRLQPGPAQLEARFDLSGPMGKPARVTLLVNGVAVATGEVARTLTFRFSLDESFDVGSDQGTPVTEAYAAPNAFTGDLRELQVRFGPAR